MSTQPLPGNPPPHSTDKNLTPFLIPQNPESLNNQGHQAPWAIPPFALIGRQTDCHVQIDDPFVSSRHARIEQKAQSFVLKDLRSTNGTFVNGLRVNEAPLKDNDSIQVGKTHFIFSLNRPETASIRPFSSRDALWQRQLDKLPHFAKSELPVLILGESGTGKELLAQQIHKLSSRRRFPFISVNCSALSESLVESELFGHVRGSFTGAHCDRRGAFEAANGGTLFLDEIGDLPLNLQPKLLRALENSEIRPLGSDKVRTIDVRIVAATHQNLVSDVESGKFRLDLYYRLHVLSIHPPPLRQRIADLESLLYGFSRQHRVSFSVEALRTLKAYSWPGNIRELKNFVARCGAHKGIGTQIEESDLEDLLQAPLAHIPQTMRQDCRRRTARTSSLIKEIEKDLILRSLKANKGNQRKTAYELGIPKSTLHDRLKGYSLQQDLNHSPQSEPKALSP